MEQQRSIGDVNGYIEEMINGQKVVKVFCYEEKAKERFAVKTKTSEKLRQWPTPWPTYSCLPQQPGICALCGYRSSWRSHGHSGVTNLSIGGEAVLTLGTIASFLTLSRNFINPIAQVSQQLNSVIMAMAGASRIFELLDEAPEEDKGTVTLVNVRTDQSGGTLPVQRKNRTLGMEGRDKLIPMKGRIDLKRCGLWI